METKRFSTSLPVYLFSFGKSNGQLIIIVVVEITQTSRKINETNKQKNKY